jgi:hypothetical protein
VELFFTITGQQMKCSGPLQLARIKLPAMGEAIPPVNHHYFLSNVDFGKKLMVMVVPLLDIILKLPFQSYKIY